MGLALVFSDTHIPFLDSKAFLEVLNALKNNKYDKVIIPGDLMDFYGISRFDNSPNRADDLEYELTCGKEVLDKIRNYHAGEVIFLEGNHCERLQRFLSRGKNRALYNLSCLKIDELLNFKKYNVINQGLYYHLNDNFIITHGTKCGIEPAKGEALAHGISGMSGHSHKTQTYKKNYYNKTIEWYSLGCLADIKALEYASRYNYQWDQSFAEIDYTNNNQKIIIHSIEK